MTTRTRTTAIMLAAVAIVIAPACGESNESEDATAASAPVATTTTAAQAPASPPAPASGATINIDGNKYTDVTVPPGAQITVVNNDAAEHSVTSDTAGTFDVHVDGKQKATLIAPTQPGTYAFHCTYHPSMQGVLTVQ